RVGEAAREWGGVAGEKLVRRDADGELEIAGRSVAADTVAAALDDAGGPVLDAGRDGDLDRPRLAEEAGAPACLAGVHDHAPRASTAGAGPLDGDGEDALLETDAAAPVARGAALDRRAGGRARA